MHQRAISMVLAIAMVMGCTTGTAAADSIQGGNEATAPDTVTRTYDSGNVRLSNRIRQTDGAIKVQLKININSISKFSEAAAVKDSGIEQEKTEPLQTTVKPVSSQAADGESGTSPVAMTAAFARSARPVNVLEADAAQQEGPGASEEEEIRLYEVRFYIPEGYRAAEGSVPDDASLAEDGRSVSWPDLTAEKIQGFSGSVKLEPEETTDSGAPQSADAAEETGDVSGIYGAASGMLLYAFGAAEATVLPPILEKSTSLADWDERTYNIHLGVTAQSQFENVSVPCDIVLVLDRSGSMKNNIDQYTPVNNPDTNKSYYILQNGSYVKVRYYKPVFHSRGWYYDSGILSVTQVYPQAGGTGTGGNYQFYTYGQISKLSALKTAAMNFVSSVQKKSAEGNIVNRIAVVSFSGEDDDGNAVTNHTNGLVQVVNASDSTSINSKIDQISAGGGTYANQGLQKAREIFNGDTPPVGKRSRVVVMFTDGEPGPYGFDSTTGFETAASTINQATVLKANLNVSTTSDVTFNDYKGTKIQNAKGCGATVYTIGVFSGLYNDRLDLVNDYMTRVATDAGKYYSVSDADSLNGIFQTIGQEVGGVSGATVKDVIDSRFRLTEDSRAELIAAGAAVVDNTNGTQTITWPNQEIKVKTENGQTVPGWIRNFVVQAKDDYVGGNNVTTNAAGSGVTYTVNGTLTTVNFEQPRINVKPGFSVDSKMATIFYGESAPNDIADGCKTWNPGSSVTYQWYRADGTTPLAAANTDFPADLVPDGTTEYKLKAIAQFGTPTDESTEATDGHTAGDAANYQLAATGTYTINVVKGEVDLTKIIDQKYPAPDSVNAKQSFVFKITRSDTKGGTAADTFYEVITPETISSSGTMKKITGLKKGYYTVTEDTDAWRYTKTGTADNDSYGGGTTADGIVFIGRKTSGQEEPTAYFGAGEGYGVASNPAAVTITNNLTNKHWLGDTTVAVNTISK